MTLSGHRLRDVLRRAYAPVTRNRTPSGAKPAQHARAHLLAFAGALLVPVLIFAGVLAWFYVEAEKGRAEERALVTARELALAVERELAAPRLMLQALATSPLLQAGNIDAFYAQASEITRTMGMTIVVRKPGETHQLLNTSLPSWGAPLVESGTAMAAYEQQVVDTKQPVVSDLIQDPATRIWRADLIVPVLRNGEVVYSLATAIPARRLSEILQEVPLDPGWFSALVDRNDVIAARSENHESFVGRRAAGDWANRPSGPQGLWTGRSLAGLEVRTAFARSPQTGWTVAVSVPVEILNAALDRAHWALAATGTTLLGIAVALAYWTGSGLSCAIGRLKEAGRAVARGDDMSAIVTQVSEVNEVGLALAIAATEVRRREAHLRSILDTVPSAMVVTDRRGRIVSFSKTAETMFGYAAKDVLGRNVSLLMPEPDRSAHDGYIARYLESGVPHIIGRGRTVTGLRKDGATFPLELHVGEANGTGETAFTGFARDLTEKQRIEQELLQTQKMEALGKLTGGVAHDFNNLLTVIRGNLELLERRLSDAGPTSVIRRVQEAVDLAAELTRSLLAFGRRMPLSPRLVDLGPLVSGTSDLMRRTLGDTISVRTIVDGAHHVLIDPGQLQNVLINLGINARDAMPSGGELTIEMCEIEMDARRVAVHPEAHEGRYVRLSIRDTGTGMSDDVKERAFEPFFTTKPAGSGTGLGLSTVYGFVKQSGGYVEIDSTLGKGTTVRIYLPCAAVDQESDSSEGDTGDPGLPRGTGETVLLVEDHVRVREVTTMRLIHLGYKVVGAGSGPEALDVLIGNPKVDLLFTDMVMPAGMSGAELAKEALRIRPDLLVLFTSGYAAPEIVDQAAAQSPSWIGKPYSVKDLAKKLRSIFDDPCDLEERSRRLGSS